ncbi:hypothetical protein HY572_04120 [Candidatus Micrarchaeota archaeon]|nr:hypothetical protein [Candidatus Micrarchaeota archaeon]
MNVLIVFDDAVQKLAEAVAEGVKEIGHQAVLQSVSKNPDPQGVDFVFLGGKQGKTFSLNDYVEKREWTGKKVSVFGIKNASGDDGTALLKKRGAQVEKNTFFAKLYGALSFLGKGRFAEDDLIRARGFGERTLNQAFDLKIQKSNGKARIQGYLK